MQRCRTGAASRSCGEDEEGGLLSAVLAGTSALSAFEWKLGVQHGVYLRYAHATEPHPVVSSNVVRSTASLFFAIDTGGGGGGGVVRQLLKGNSSKHFDLALGDASAINGQR